MDENLIGHVAVGLTRGARSGGVRGGQQLAERPASIHNSLGPLLRPAAARRYWGGPRGVVRRVGGVMKAVVWRLAAGISVSCLCCGVSHTALHAKMATSDESRIAFFSLLVEMHVCYVFKRIII